MTTGLVTQILAGGFGGGKFWGNKAWGSLIVSVVSDWLLLASVDGGAQGIELFGARGMSNAVFR